jgi:aminopeptidase
MFRPSLRDPPFTALAHLLVSHSLDVQPGERVLVAGPQTAAALIRAVEKAIARAGGVASVFSWDSADALQETALRTRRPAPEVHACVFVESGEEPAALRNWTPEQGLVNRFLDQGAPDRIRWVVTLAANEADAARAGQSLRAWTELLHDASFLNENDPAGTWTTQSLLQEGLIKRLRAAKAMRLQTREGADLHLQVAGRRWINGDGKINMPDGEVYSAPLEDSTTGILVLPGPIMSERGDLADLRLRFEKGEVVEARAGNGQEMLDRLLSTDPGARLVGEVAFGCNPKLAARTHHTLLDEKIGGTFHLALGTAYPQTGGQNRSRLHWDLVADLRNGGRVELDGVVANRNGVWL